LFAKTSNTSRRRRGSGRGRTSESPSPVHVAGRVQVNQRRDSGDEQAHGDRGGRRASRPHVQRPDEIHEKRLTVTSRDEWWMSMKKVMTASTKLAATTPVRRRRLAFRSCSAQGRSTLRKPKTASAVAGLRRSPSQPFISESSSTEVGRAPTEDRHHDARPTVTSAAATTSREDDRLTTDVIQRPREGDEREVDGVQHQFDAHNMMSAERRVNSPKAPMPKSPAAKTRYHAAGTFTRSPHPGSRSHVARARPRRRRR